MQMKNSSKPRVKLALRTETLRALDAVQLAHVAGGGLYTVPPNCKIKVTVSLFCD